MDPSPPDAGAACARVFWTWLCARTTLWFGAIVLAQPNPLQDLVESLAWGHHFAWGYPKQPPLTSWLAEAFGRLSPGDVWGLYLAGYLFAALGLWAVWRVACTVLPPAPALLATMSLDGLAALTGEAAEFNNNILLCAFWTLAVLCFLRATSTGALRWWLALGVVAGLGLLCKYPIVFLLAPLGGYLLVDRDGRRCWRTPGPYLAVLTAAALFLPHVVWLVRHDFLPFEYAAMRTGAKSRAFGRVLHPLSFVSFLLLRSSPALLVVVPWLGRRPRDAARPPAVLHWAVVGPLALILAYSALTGAVLRDRWGGPFAALLGVWLVATFGRFDPALPRLRFSAATWAVVTVGVLAVWIGQIRFGPYLENTPPRASYPGRQLTAEVLRRWQEQSADPLPIVAGEAWRASNVCTFAPHRPIVYTSGDMGLFAFDPRRAFWTDDADLAERGGVILWGAQQVGDDLPAWVRARFPDAEVQPPIVLPYQTAAKVRPDRVGVAFVWPAADRLARAGADGATRRR